MVVESKVLVLEEPYKEYHDDIIQFVGSIQLCLTLLTGLILNLQQGTHSEMGEEEKRNLGILLVVMNLGIIFAGIAALFASTSYGKKCFVKYIGVKSKHQEKKRTSELLLRAATDMDKS